MFDLDSNYRVGNSVYWSAINESGKDSGNGSGKGYGTILGNGKGCSDLSECEIVIIKWSPSFAKG